MDHLHEHQRSTIDRHHEFENQGFVEEEEEAGAKGAGEGGEGAHGFQEEEDDGAGDGAGDGDGAMVDLEEEEPVVDEEHAGGSQLTLSYQGEVYLFENVPVEKVHDVLTVLGGQEIQSFTNVPSYLSYPKNQSLLEPPGPGQRLNPRDREEYIRRYREKRERRIWGKRILYSVRSNVAVKMNRHKGQFAPFKVKEEESEEKPATSTPAVETVCQGCGCASGTTPMMRKGPAGPKTLCNACGLMWANKGVLKSSQVREQKTPQQPLQHQQHQQQQDDLVPCQNSSPKVPRGTKRKTRAT
ncbi:GATA transcription factor 17 isoform X2 [Selaginella moellendorffii]|uniref:GATA transcription factor 17 isoform X2 n=1 Tax=Selaginella moellendorffii TaxID=88036 RepID=UPI000D1CA3AB|nr:GATA transcription factor 17 isoform X2 [Selaginella moellendorffii]|eukprot:XP_024534585.1 GATA transcription factor 17 isoform X2 [Selaginella moellendorffii]